MCSRNLRNFCTRRSNNTQQQSLFNVENVDVLFSSDREAKETSSTVADATVGQNSDGEFVETVAAQTASEHSKDGHWHCFTVEDAVQVGDLREHRQLSIVRVSGDERTAKYRHVA